MTASSLNHSKAQRILEYFICFSVWSGACLYSAYKFYQKSQSLTERYVQHFHVGPSWLSHLEQSDDLNKDHGDGEWAFWQDCIIPILILQIIRIFIRYFIKNWTNWSPLLLLIVDLTCCLYLIGLFGLIFHLVLTGIFFLVALAKKKILIWILAVNLLILIVFFRFLPVFPIFPEMFWMLEMEPFDRYLLEMTTCYLVIRSISFASDYGDRVSVEEVESDSPVFHHGEADSLSPVFHQANSVSPVFRHADSVSSSDSVSPVFHQADPVLPVFDDDRPLEIFFSFLQYQFFLPLYFIGPHLDYNTFCRKISSRPKLNRKFLIGLALKIALAVAFFELFSHFLYPFSVRFDQEIIETMDLWSLAGVAYTLGQFFHLKYLALFGTFGLFASLNGVDWAPLPICVGWVHRYSLMWQYFDQGLYVFLKRNIYMPLTKNGFFSRKIASLGCFAFILLWHGLFHRHIFIWVATNWATLFLEKIIYNSKIDERLKALANVPVMIASIVANMFFLGDSEFFAWQILKRIFFTNSFANIFGVFVIFYCGSFAGQIIQKWKYPSK